MPTNDERKTMNMKRSTWIQLMWAAAAAFVLTACGGNNNQGATISGTISGLTSGQSVLLTNNLNDTITVSANGSFEFPKKIGAGNAYYVTVSTQPTGSLCLVANGNGAVDSSANPVNNVNVTCTGLGLVGGTVSGLASGATLVLANGTGTVSITSNGNFVFPSTYTIGTVYSVTVTTQPTGQTCTFGTTGATASSGYVSTTSSSAVVVTCA